MLRAQHKTMRSYDLIIVGGGMAAGRLLQQLVEFEYAGSICVVSRESRMGYNRVLLPGFLAGQCGIEDLNPVDDASASGGIEVLVDTSVVQIDFDTRTALLDQNTAVQFSNLVFATGSTVPIPEMPGTQLPNVCELRSLADATTIQEIASEVGRVVVIGGGLLGLEAADALNQMSLRVTVIQRAQHLMNRQLDEESSTALARHLEESGIELLLGARVSMVMGELAVSGVALEDGKEIQADLVLFATGASPNVELALDSGVICRGGISTDQYLRTNVGNVYALGECANVAGEHYTLVEAVHAQAEALARTLCGDPQPFFGCTPGTRLKISSTQLFSVGAARLPATARSNEVVVRDEQAGVYRRLLFDGAELIGAILMGDTIASREISERVGSVVSGADRDRLAFGQSLVA